MNRRRVALIPGDGIGQEVIPAAVAVLDAVADRHDLDFSWEQFDWGSERYLRTGSMMPGDGIEELGRFDAILLGAVGVPGVPDAVTLWSLLIPIRRAFHQYLNLRPIRRFDAIDGPLRSNERIDFVIIRENNEGEYSNVGGRVYEGSPEEAALQESIFTRRGVERIADCGFEYAKARGGRLTSATKSNGIVHTMPFWDQIMRERAAQHPDVRLEEEHIDALCAKLVLRPGDYDVIVASNLFGDILSDLAAALAGSIGIAPSANINPERRFPSMFEPIHGSAPDIAGQGIANPLGAIWSGALMLAHLGHDGASDDIVGAIPLVLSNPRSRTPDLGGTASTDDVAAALIVALAR